MQKYSIVPWRENMLFAWLLSDPLKPARIQSPAQTRQHGGHQPGRRLSYVCVLWLKVRLLQQGKMALLSRKSVWNMMRALKMKSGCERHSVWYELLVGLESETIKKNSGWMAERFCSYGAASAEATSRNILCYRCCLSDHSHIHQCNMTGLFVVCVTHTSGFYCSFCPLCVCTLSRGSPNEGER